MCTRQGATRIKRERRRIRTQAPRGAVSICERASNSVPSRLEPQRENRLGRPEKPHQGPVYKGQGWPGAPKRSEEARGGDSGLQGPETGKAQGLGQRARDAGRPWRRPRAHTVTRLQAHTAAQCTQIHTHTQAPAHDLEPRTHELHRPRPTRARPGRPETRPSPPPGPSALPLPRFPSSRLLPLPHPQAQPSARSLPGSLLLLAKTESQRDNAPARPAQITRSLGAFRRPGQLE